MMKPFDTACFMAAEEMWPNFRWALFMSIFSITAFACCPLEAWFEVMTRYRPSEWGMVAMVRLFEFFIVHICLWNITLWSALSRRLIYRRVNAIPGACMAFLKTVLVVFDLFGRSRVKSPIPMALTILPSAVIISR